MPRALRHQPLADIAAGGDAHAERVARVLVDEAPVGTMQRAQLRRRHGMHIVQRRLGVAIEHLAGVGPDAAGEDIEKRGLAGAAFADDGEHLAGPEHGVDTVEGVDRAEGQAEVMRFEEGDGHIDALLDASCAALCRASTHLRRRDDVWAPQRVGPRDKPEGDGVGNIVMRGLMPRIDPLRRRDDVRAPQRVGPRDKPEGDGVGNIVMRGLMPRIDPLERHDDVRAPPRVGPRDEPEGDGVGNIVMRGLVPRNDPLECHNGVWAPERVGPRDKPEGDGVGNIVMRGLMPRIYPWVRHNGVWAPLSG